MASTHETTTAKGTLSYDDAMRIAHDFNKKFFNARNDYHVDIYADVDLRTSIMRVTINAAATGTESLTGYLERQECIAQIVANAIDEAWFEGYAVEWDD